MKKFLIISLIALLTAVGMNLGHPVTPFYIAKLEFPDWTFGVFFAVMSLGMLLMAPLWGTLGDSGGRKIILIAGCIFYSLGQVLFGVFNLIPSIIFARFFSGCFSAAINVSIMAYATASEDLKSFSKARLISTIVSLQVIGGSIGNYFGGVLSNYALENYHYVFFYQAIYLSIIAMLILMFFKANDELLMKKENKSFLANLKNVKKLNSSSLLFLFCLMGFSLVFTTLQKYLDIFFRDMGKTASDIGFFNLIIGLVTFSTNLLLTPLLLRKLKAIPLIIASSILGTICIIFTFQFTNLFIGLYTFYMLYIITKAIIEPSSVHYITDNQDLKPGLLLGVRQSFISLGSVIGPLAGGIIYNYYGMTLFYICACLMITSGFGIIVYQLKKRKIDKF